jgi:predicted SAM-dependent methyltransferase
VNLELGGGLSPWAGYVNLDPVHGEGEFRRRAQDGIPLADGSVEQARCSHLMEHIPAGPERLFVFNEVWRVLRPGARFEVIVPLLIPGRWEPVADPTHVSFWVKESFDYFTGAIRPAAEYGIHYWEMADWSVRDGWEGHAILRKPG